MATTGPRRQHSIGGIKELMQLSEAFHFQLELGFGPGESWPAGHSAELLGQATPRIRLEDSGWRIQGIKVVLGVTSQMREDSVSQQDLKPPLALTNNHRGNTGHPVTAS